MNDPDDIDEKKSLMSAEKPLADMKDEQSIKSGESPRKQDEEQDEQNDRPGYKVVGRCVQNYPQAIADKDKPRLAYWTCDRRIEDCCMTTFAGCGRTICDLHCRKFTDFRRGKRGQGIIMREYLDFFCCYDCLPKVYEARAKKANRGACIGWIACIVLGIVVFGLLIFMAST